MGFSSLFPGLQAQLLEQVGALLGTFASERSRALSQGMQVG